MVFSLCATSWRSFSGTPKVRVPRKSWEKLCDELFAADAEAIARQARDKRQLRRALEPSSSREQFAALLRG